MKLHEIVAFTKIVQTCEALWLAHQIRLCRNKTAILGRPRISLMRMEIQSARSASL